MKKSARFRLGTPTFGLTSHDGETRPILIPAGSVVQIVSGIEDSQRMVEVHWDGVNVMMFVQDVQARGELL